MMTWLALVGLAVVVCAILEAVFVRSERARLAHASDDELEFFERAVIGSLWHGAAGPMTFLLAGCTVGAAAVAARFFEAGQFGMTVSVALAMMCAAAWLGMRRGQLKALRQLRRVRE